MADDHVGRPAVAQHLGGDLTGMGAAWLGMAVLTADQNAASFHRLGDRQDQRRRRTDQHLAVAPACLSHAVRDGLGQRQGIGPETVHLPVAGDQWSSRTRHGISPIVLAGVSSGGRFDGQRPLGCLSQGRVVGMRPNQKPRLRPRPQPPPAP